MLSRPFLDLAHRMRRARGRESMTEDRSRLAMHAFAALYLVEFRIQSSRAAKAWHPGPPKSKIPPRFASPRCQTRKEKPAPKPARVLTKDSRAMSGGRVETAPILAELCSLNRAVGRSHPDCFGDSEWRCPGPEVERCSATLDSRTRALAVPSSGVVPSLFCSSPGSGSTLHGHQGGHPFRSNLRAKGEDRSAALIVN